MLGGLRKVVIACVCAALLIAGCSVDPTPVIPATPSGVVEGELAESDLTLTLDGIVVTVPPTAAPRGTLVRLERESNAEATATDTSRITADADKVASVSKGIVVTLGNDLQPAAPITISFPVRETTADLAPDGEAALVMRSVSSDGTVSLASGTYDGTAGTFTAQTDHLSLFEVFKIDLGAAVAEAKTAMLQSIGLEYPEPGCTGDIARVDGYSYTVPQPPQSWLCASIRDGALQVTAQPNSVIPFVVTSKQAASLRTNLSEVSISTSVLVALADLLDFTSSGQAAVMPGTTATLTFSGALDEVTISIEQYPVLLLMAILAKTVDTVMAWFRIGNTFTELLAGMQCLVDVAKVAPPGSSLNGESASALTRAFFSCAEPLAGDILSGAGKVILSIIAAAPGFLAGSALGIINEWTGDARATVELDVTKPPRPACGGADLGLNLAGASGAAAETARVIYRATATCDSQTLIDLAHRDSTELSLGLFTPESAFAVPNLEDRYAVISKLMSTPPQVYQGGLHWPAWDPDLSAEQNLAPLVAAGIHPPGSADSYVFEGVYYGWKLSISADGTFSAMFEGD